MKSIRKNDTLTLLFLILSILCMLPHICFFVVNFMDISSNFWVYYSRIKYLLCSMFSFICLMSKQSRSFSRLFAIVSVFFFFSLDSLNFSYLGIPNLFGSYIVYGIISIILLFFGTKIKIPIIIILSLEIFVLIFHLFNGIPFSYSVFISASRDFINYTLAMFFHLGVIFFYLAIIFLLMFKNCNGLLYRKETLEDKLKKIDLRFESGKISQEKHKKLRMRIINEYLQ